MAAPSAAARVAVLVIDEDGAGLEAELSGATQPELVVVLGDLPSVDVRKLQAVASNFSESLPGYHATIVFLSRDAGGELHRAAVSVHTDGGPVEVSIR
jgi:hypothetical protein